MDSFYIIVDSFQVKDKTVLAFDRKLDDDVLRSKYIYVDGEELPFYLTYNEYWLMIDGEQNFTGKRASFSE